MYYLDASKIYRGPQAERGAGFHAGDPGRSRLVRSAKPKPPRSIIEEAIERYQGEWDDAGAARTLMSLGDLEKRLGRPDAAQEHYRQAAQIWHKERDSQALARALTSLGEMQNRFGKDRAGRRKLLARRGTLSCEPTTTLRLAVALRCLADVRRSLKKIEPALAHYEEAIGLFRAEGENSGPRQRSAEPGRSGDSLRQSGRRAARTTTKRWCFTARKTTLSASPIRCAAWATWTGEWAGSIVARSNYEQAMELYRSAGNNIGLANTLQSLGDLEKRLGKLSDAEQRYTQAIQIYRSRRRDPRAWLMLSRAWAMWNRRVAICTWRKITTSRRSSCTDAAGRSLGLANPLQSLGDLERRQKRFKEATAHYSTARDLYRQEKHMTRPGLHLQRDWRASRTPCSILRARSSI